MLLLLFQLGENLYAIDTDKIVKIVPMVQLRKVTTAPDHLVGVFNYGGQIVPVLDLCHLLSGVPCRICYSTRLMLVKNQPKVEIDPGQAASHSLIQNQLGLMAERVTETIKISANQLKNAQRISAFPALSELFIDEKGMIQLIHWESLMTDEMIGKIPSQGL